MPGANSRPEAAFTSYVGASLFNLQDTISIVHCMRCRVPPAATQMA